MHAGVVLGQGGLQLGKAAAQGQADGFAAGVKKVGNGDVARRGQQLGQGAGRNARAIDGDRRHGHGAQRHFEAARAFVRPDLEVVRQPGGSAKAPAQQGQTQ